MDNNHRNDRPIEREIVHDGGRAGRGTTTVAWIALLLAIAALALAGWAFSRTVDNLDERIQQGVNEATQSVEQGVDSTTDAVDAGPDGVDEDDTGTTNPQSAQ